MLSLAVLPKRANNARTAVLFDYNRFQKQYKVMLNYIDTQNALHTRTIDYTLEEYFFVLQVVMGEDIRVAYANSFDSAEFNRNIPSEEEEEYLDQYKQVAQNMLEEQRCAHLKEYLEDEYQSEIQSRASTLKDYKFTGADVQQLLANLLHNRVGEGNLDDASVKDVISLIKSMYDSGALDSGDQFQRHYITIPKKYDSLCVTCGHEFYAVEGLDMKCPSCGQVYKWDANRFWPQPMKL